MTASHSSVVASAAQPDVDALLLFSFGGPEGAEDVRPFLENVTRGRGIPPERLDEVEEHYHHFDGLSPLNALNREIIEHIRAEFARRGWETPVYFGNRNWHPMGAEAAEAMAWDGIRTAAVFATSAWGSGSGCRQYHEDIAAMRQHLAAVGVPEIEFRKLRQFYDHPIFIEESVKATRAALDEARSKADDARLVFTAHSIPTAADKSSGLPEDGTLYSDQVREAAALIARRLGVQEYDVVWQSRSGSPHTPWLEPDIVDHVRNRAILGDRAFAVSPIGFVSDHVEVVWDLDHELADVASTLGVAVARARTVGHTEGFAAMVADLLVEPSGAPARLGALPCRGAGVNGAPCTEGCCEPVRGGHPGGRPGPGHPRAN